MLPEHRVMMMSFGTRVEGMHSQIILGAKDICFYHHTPKHTCHHSKSPSNHNELLFLKYNIPEYRYNNKTSLQFCTHFPSLHLHPGGSHPHIDQCLYELTCE